VAMSTAEVTSAKTRYLELGSSPGVGLRTGATVVLALQVCPPSAEAAAMAWLPVRLFSFGELIQVSYTVPSGPILIRASWSNWWPLSLTVIGPVQCWPLSSENATWIGERPDPLNCAQVM